jgi:hypothetical protein
VPVRWSIVDGYSPWTGAVRQIQAAVPQQQLVSAGQALSVLLIMVLHRH